MELILKDGVRYLLHTYSSEKELEKMIFEHFKDIFGENTILLPKQKICTSSGIGTIPDAFVLSLKDKKWYIVEVELKSHPLYDHIVPQIGKFNRAIMNRESQSKLLTAFHKEIKCDPWKSVVFQVMKITEEVYKYISEILDFKPEIIIFIDERNTELDDVRESLPFPLRVITFKTYCREDVGIGDHIHMFEPLTPINGIVPTAGNDGSEDPIPKEVYDRPGRVEIIDLLNARYINPGFVIYRTYMGETFKAEILSDGRIKILRDNRIGKSPSNAAGLVTGTNQNGWTWWKFRDENNRELSIDVLRQKYLLEVRE